MKYIMTTQSADRTGIVAELTSCLARFEGFITELAQFGTPSSEQFYSRIEFTMNTDQFTLFQKELDEICNKFDLNTEIFTIEKKLRTVLMVSKFDHCLNDILYRYRTGMLNIEIPAIISNHNDLAPLAQTAGIPYHHIPISKETKGDAETALRQIIEETETDLIVLARYMQVLTDTMCRDYSGRIINIHHSFLPSFKGAKPYHRAYERGVKLIGATAHYVTADLDEGPIIEQMVKRVNHKMQPAELTAMGRDVEAQTLAQAIKLHAEHRVFLNDAKTVILP